MNKQFEEEIQWLTDKIDILTRSDKMGVYKDEIKMLKRIKNNYKFCHNQNSKLSSELSWTKNPDPGY